jgi:hypothetical protein
MKINRNFNVTFKIEGFTFHSTPLDYEFFEDNIDMFAEVERLSYGLVTSIKQAYIYPQLKRLAKERGAQSELARFVEELQRNTCIVEDGDYIMLNTAILQGIVPANVAAKAYGAIVFFTQTLWAREAQLAAVMEETKETAEQVVTSMLGTGGLSSTSLGITGFIASLATLTATDNPKATA